MSHIANISRTLLRQADEFAVETVKAEQGGPFGAITAVASKKTGTYIVPTEPRANAVLSKGIGSAHAEDQALQPDDVQALVLALQKWNIEKDGNPVVLFESSGQSCQACLAKQAIVAGGLIDRSLIKPGHFIVGYGATFQQTAEIAGFNDLPYVLDLIRYARGSNSSRSMVNHSVVEFADIPENVRKLFQDTAKPITVIARGNQILSVGYNERSEFDLLSTAEVVAMRKAAADQKEDGKGDPWVLGDTNYLNPAADKVVTLYTATPEIGPLMRGEAQWAAVNNIVSVRGLQKDKGLWETQEMQGMSNGRFLRSLAEGYNYSGTNLVTIRDPFFANKAQAEWVEQRKRKGESIQYNGMTGDDDGLDRYVAFLKRAFKGEPLHYV